MQDIRPIANPSIPGSHDDRQAGMRDIRSLNEMIRHESQFVDAILAEMGKVVVGQQQMVERLLIGLLTGGHVLLEGVPGLAKTLTCKTLAKCLQIRFQRIQFTPDLLPADILGTQIYNPRDQSFSVKRGPIFTNLVLADEINRAPAKVQSALLEAMQEHQITIGDETFFLEEPFLVLATQNPIEQEGTYPLPEAQVDRFMLMVKVGYPSKAEELQILNNATNGYAATVNAVLDGDQLLKSRKVVEDILIDDKLKQYIVDIVFATRDPKAYGLADLSEFIQFGASPRATIFLTQAAKAHAFLRHRGFVIPEDIKAIGLDVLRHRVILTYQAEAESLTSDDVVQRIFDRIAVP
jgi:MoxR-like ATPase